MPDKFNPENSIELKNFADIFLNSSKKIIKNLAGKDVKIMPGSVEIITQEDFVSKFDKPPFLFSNDFNGMSFSIITEQDGALTLADCMMSGDGETLPDSGELYFKTAQEGISQIAEETLKNLSKKLIQENIKSELAEDAWMLFKNESSSDEIWAFPETVNIAAESFKIWLCMLMNNAEKLAEFISSQNQPESLVEFKPLIQSPGKNLQNPVDLIVDLPIKVTAELGRARRSLSEISAFTPGVVIELDKMSDDPVNVLINGKVVAQCKLDVTDGKFVIKITEISAKVGDVITLDLDQPEVNVQAGSNVKFKARPGTLSGHVAVELSRKINNNPE